MNVADQIRAHAIGVDMSAPQTERSLKSELNWTRTEITRLEFQLMMARREAAKWHRGWIVTFGLLQAAVVILVVLLSWRIV